MPKKLDRIDKILKNQEKLNKEFDIVKHRIGVLFDIMMIITKPKRRKK